MEYKMKCNVCGKVFCYTDEDLKKNATNAGMGALSALGGLASALGGGTIFHTHHLQGQADRYTDKIVDYNQCPYCHSRSLSVFTGNAEEDTKVVKTVTINTSASTESLLKRIFIFLEDGEWETADAYCEACLDKDPESAEAYLGKLMAELHVKVQGELENQAKPFDNNANYRKAVRYADDELRNTLIGYINYINNRNENTRKDNVLRDAKAKMTGKAISNYEEALSLFASIPGWKDADEQKSICQSKIAELKAKEEADRLERERLAEIEREKAEKEAAVARAKAKKTKKLLVILIPIVTIIALLLAILPGMVNQSRAYNDAIMLLDSGNTIAAYEALVALDGYKDSSDLAKSIYEKYLYEKCRQTEVYISFGEYEQDNIISNGKENIDWLVLDVKDNKVLVISKFALDCQPYNTRKESVTWETCTLRNWLNNDFLNEAFSDTERSFIAETAVTADGNYVWNTAPGNETVDKIFLLSIPETEMYFSFSENHSTAECKPTNYATANGVKVNSDAEYKNNCNWWLRSPGMNENHASRVYTSGHIDTGGGRVNYDEYGVRPVLWLDIRGLSQS